ncbi:hypothetical protein ACKWTF_006677 [Chironomus riparius]
MLQVCMLHFFAATRYSKEMKFNTFFQIFVSMLRRKMRKFQIESEMKMIEFDFHVFLFVWKKASVLCVDCVFILVKALTFFFVESLRILFGNLFKNLKSKKHIVIKLMETFDY